MNNIGVELRVKKLLPRTWSAFFSRHGRFFPIQVKTIPLVLQKKNVLVKAPTGTGKTEAVVAPLVERMVLEKWQKLSVLYVIPTRALANDTMKRLSPVLEQLGIEIKRKTGDFAYEFKPSSPCPILVITPESLDSLLCRHPQVFSHLRAIILDELHLLDNTVRGDQVRVLLQRIRNLFKTPERIQYCALSATFEKGQEVASRYFEPAVIVEDERKKFINAELYQHASQDDWQEVLFRITQQGYKKILVFCNSRTQAEQTAHELDIPPFKGQVYVHHGSLHKGERERVEQFMNERKVGLCVATMTLEFGIDIGDIDVIILHKPPLSVASFLQRIGRGCRRRSSSTNVIGIYENDWEGALFECLITLANSNEGDDSYYYPRYSVAIQQIMSLLRQKMHHGVLFDDIDAVLKPLFLSHSNPAEILIPQLSSKGLLEVTGDRIYPGDRMHAIFDSPQLHSNIGEFKESSLEIRAIEDGKKIGAIAEQVILQGDSLLLAGHKWKVEFSEGNVAYVSGETHRAAEVKRFAGYSYPVLPFKLAQAIKKNYYPDLPDGSMVLRKDAEHDVLFHFSGKLYGEFLARLYHVKYRIHVKDVDGIYFAMAKTEAFNPSIIKADVNQCATKYYKTLASLMNMGRYFNYLPVALQKENVLNALNVEFLLNYVNTATLINE